MAIDNEKTTREAIPYWQPGMQLFLKLSGWIGGPVLIALVVGKYLDTKYHTDPWLFLFSVGIAFAVSTWAIIHYGLREMNRIEKEFPPKNPNTTKQHDQT
jgi:F0F1-type ATP synthase assembly protein I